MKYILNAKGNPVREPDLNKWVAWFETAKRHVADEKIGKSRISTVFLGLDHGFDDRKSPVLWESLVFGGKLSGKIDRCSGSREQAEAMHAKMVARVKAAQIQRLQRPQRRI